MVGWFMGMFGSNDRGIYAMAVSLLLACVVVYMLPKSLSTGVPKQTTTQSKAA